MHSEIRAQGTLMHVSQVNPHPDAHLTPQP
jgi:hypothetical protein